jgi:hypothetical protein
MDGIAYDIYFKGEKKLTYFSDILDCKEKCLTRLKSAIHYSQMGIKNSGIVVDCSPYALDDNPNKKRVIKALRQIWGYPKNLSVAIGERPILDCVWWIPVH